MDDFDYLDFDIFDGVDVSETVVTDNVIETAGPDLADYVSRSHNYWQQVPLPTEMHLCGTNTLGSLSDEVLLGMSPSLLVHIQRTEAAGGLQVVSPRAVTLGGIAARTMHSHRTTDMYLVGSAASRNTEWPVVRDPIDPRLFWNEPIDSYPSEPASRPRTVTTGLVPSPQLVDDPITRAFLTGRALVDLQRRPDVSGSAEALSSLLADCWGIDQDAYEDLAEASLAPTGQLLRYAIRSDSVYPTVNAPVQARKCMSVGANTAGRHLYGESSAIDWRRMRVLAESVFYQSSRLEGWTLSQMAMTLPPGNPRAPPDRPGILQLRPLPGSVWTFDSSTFRVEVNVDVAAVMGVRVPDRVRRAVERYHDEVRPIARAADAGAKLSYSTSLSHNVASVTGETLVRGYKEVLTQHAAFSARGRTAAAAARGFVYDTLADASKLSSIRALWVARYMHETSQALNIAATLDVTASRHVAARLSLVTADIRARMGVEAGRRGADLAEWWSDFSAQLPAEISIMDEGSASWAIGIAHMIIHPPTPKWSSLVHAMSHASHATLARQHLVDVRLPAKVGSLERILQAGQAVARQLGASYGAYYAAVYDVACVLSARMKRAGRARLAEKLLLAGMMWDIRAKVASTVTLHADDGTKTAAGVVTSRHGTLHLTTAPYPAYQRWRHAINSSGAVSRGCKSVYPHHAPPRISEVFQGQAEPIISSIAVKGCRLTRYVDSPDRLARDIERTLAEITADVQAVVDFYGAESVHEEAVLSRGPTRSAAIVPLALDLGAFKPKAGTYWDVLAEMEPLVAQDIVDTVARMDNSVSSEIEMASYSGPDELLRVALGQDASAEESRHNAQDAVM